jgi:hypothetical protein
MMSRWRTRTARVSGGIESKADSIIFFILTFYRRLEFTQAWVNSICLTAAEFLGRL